MGIHEPPFLTNARHVESQPALPPVQRLATLQRRNAVPFALGFLVVIALLAAWQLGVDIPRLTRDANTVNGSQRSTGALSLFGVALEAATVAIAAFATLVTPRGLRSRAGRTFAATAFLMGVVGFDDALQVHESAASMLPRGEILYAVGYGALAMAWLTVVAPWRGGPSRAVLAAALFFLGGSLVVDVARDIVVPGSGGALTTFEDGLKLAGLALFLAWTTATGVHELKAPHAVSRAG